MNYIVSKHSKNTSIRIKKHSLVKLIESCYKYKHDYINGIKYVLETIKRASAGDYHIHHNDYIISDYRKTTPSINDFLNEHGGISMKSEELNKALNDYETMIDNNKTIMDDRITAYVSGMKTMNALFTLGIVITVTIMIVII